MALVVAGRLNKQICEITVLGSVRHCRSDCTGLTTAGASAGTAYTGRAVLFQRDPKPKSNKNESQAAFIDPQML
jgi:hypothetical protein